MSLDPKPAAQTASERPMASPGLIKLPRLTNGAASSQEVCFANRKLLAGYSERVVAHSIDPRYTRPSRLRFSASSAKSCYSYPGDPELP